MRDPEKIKNSTDDRQNIDTPIILAVSAVAVLILCLVWFGVKDPPLFEKMRDLVISLTSALLFILGAAVSVLFFFLSSRIGDAKNKIDAVLSQADIKIVEIAEKITVILKQILQPVIESESEKAGILHVFSVFRKKD